MLSRTLFCCLIPYIILYSGAALGTSPRVQANPEPSIPEVIIYASPPENQTVLGKRIDLSSVEALQKGTSADALKQIPGVTLNSFGTYGSQTYLKVRGANTEQTQVRILGVEVNDPSGGGRFDISTFFPEDADSMTLQTSSNLSAVGGALDIEPRRTSPAHQTCFSAEGGSYRTGKARAELSDSTGSTSYFISGTLLTTGTGQLKNDFRGNTVSDHHKTGALNARVEHHITPLWGTTLYLSQGQSQFALNQFKNGLPFKSSDQGAHQHSIAVSKNSLHVPGSAWEHQVTLSAVNHRNDSLVSSQSYPNKSLSFGTHYEAKFDASAHHHLKGALGLTQDQVHLFASGRHSIQAQYTEMTYKTDALSRLLVEIKGRLDHHTFFKIHPTYRGFARYALTPDFAVFGSYGTSFRPPTAFDLYASGPSSEGNPNLKPMTSQNREAGFELALFEDVLFSLASFHLHMKDMLVTILSSEGKFQRINSGRITEGLEMFVTFPVLEHALKGRAGYTFITGTDKETQKSPIRLPRHHLSLGLETFCFDKTILFAEAFYSASCFDTVFSTNTHERMKLPSSLTVRVGGSYQLSDLIDVKARVENLFNDKSEAVYGFPDRGVSLFIGATLKI